MAPPQADAAVVIMAVDNTRVEERRAVTVAPHPAPEEPQADLPERADAEPEGSSNAHGGSVDAERADARPLAARTRRQKTAAAAVAIMAVCLTGFSALHLSGGIDTGGFLQTTAGSSQSGLLSSRGDNGPDRGEGGAAFDGADETEAEPSDSASVPDGLGGEAGYGSPPAAGSVGSADGLGESSAESASDGPGGGSGQSAAQNQAPATVTVSVSVSSENADGSVFGGANPTFPQGATAYDALCATGLPVAASGGYVSSIGGLSERDSRYGPSSGWTYSVNGSFPSVACTEYVLDDGDAVRWIYVV